MLQAARGEAKGLWLLPAPLQLLKGQYQAQEPSAPVQLRGHREGTMGSGMCQDLTTL